MPTITDLLYGGAGMQSMQPGADPWMQAMNGRSGAPFGNMDPWMLMQLMSGGMAGMGGARMSSTGQGFLSGAANGAMPMTPNTAGMSMQQMLGGGMPKPMMRPMPAGIAPYGSMQPGGGPGNPVGMASIIQRMMQYR